MKTNLVPQDIYLKHEEEWQAVRSATENRSDAGGREKQTWYAAYGASRCSNDNPSVSKAS